MYKISPSLSLSRSFSTCIYVYIYIYICIIVVGGPLPPARFAIPALARGKLPRSGSLRPADGVRQRKRSWEGASGPGWLYGIVGEIYIALSLSLSLYIYIYIYTHFGRLCVSFIGTNTKNKRQRKGAGDRSKGRESTEVIKSTRVVLGDIPNKGVVSGVLGDIPNKGSFRGYPKQKKRRAISPFNLPSLNTDLY